MIELVSTATNAVAIVLVVKIGASLVGFTTWRAQRFPRGAAALSALVAMLSITQLAWPSVLHALDRQPGLIMHGQAWRLVTAGFVQDGGIGGTAFNLVSLAAVAALAEWHWGARRMVAIFIVGDLVLNVQGALFDVAGAGSSGATFTVGASLAGALILAGTGRQRLHALTCPLLGAGMFALGNVHGLALLYGTIIGLASGAWRRRSATDPRPRSGAPGPAGSPNGRWLCGHRRAIEQSAGTVAPVRRLLGTSRTDVPRGRERLWHFYI